MKRLISLFLTLMLLACIPALAETPSTVTLTLPAANITIDVPAHWYYATPEMGSESPLAQLFGIPGTLAKSILDENGWSLYATLDETETAVCYLSILPGTPLIDMRSGHVNMDAVMGGFMQTFSSGEVLDSRAFYTDEAAYARILCGAEVEGGQARILVYGCNTNSQIIILSFIAYPGAELPEAEVDAMVESIHFLN